MNISPTAKSKIRKLANLDYTADQIAQKVKIILPKASMYERISAVKQVLFEEKLNA